MMGHQAKIAISHYKLEYDGIALLWRTRNRQPTKAFRVGYS